VLAALALRSGGAAVREPPERRERPRQQAGEVCELAYYTGSFAAYGKALTNDVRFPIEEVINLDPPLGRTWELVSEDIGDDHEGQAAKICLEQHKAEIVVSIATSTGPTATT
jgi:hypothetical protein